MRQLKISQVRHNASKILQIYYNEINKVYIIDEVDLSNKIKLGNKKALDLLVKANLKFVVSVAKQYLYYGIPIEDLIDEGNIGLINAAKRFDNSRGFKFISYAVWHIRQSILQHIQQNTNLVRIPLNIQTDLNTLKKLLNTTEQEQGIEMTYSVANALLDDPKLERLFTSYGKKDISLDEVIGEDGFTLGDGLILSDNTLNPDTVLNNNETLRILNKAIKSLTDLEQQIIILTYGLNNRSTLNITNICKECNIYEGRYNTILRKATKKLKFFIIDYNNIVDTDNLKSKNEITNKYKYTKPKLNNSSEIKQASVRHTGITNIKIVSDDIILDHYFGKYTGTKSTVANVASTLNISKANVYSAVYRYNTKKNKNS